MSGLSLILTATAVGAIAAGAVLSKLSVPRKVFLSCLSWCLLLPGYLLLAVAGGLSAALAGTFLVGVGTGAAFVLMTSATQESVEESVLGRAMGIISLGSFGAKPIGLLLIAPFYVFLDPGVMFLAGGPCSYARSWQRPWSMLRRGVIARPPQRSDGREPGGCGRRRAGP